jgi:hypothetical protein
MVHLRQFKDDVKTFSSIGLIIKKQFQSRQTKQNKTKKDVQQITFTRFLTMSFLTWEV